MKLRYIGSSLLFFFTLTLFPPPGCAQANASAKPQVRKFKHNSKVESIYDKAKDQTTTYLRPMTVTSAPGSIEAQIMSEGKKTETIPGEVLSMTAYFVSPGKTAVKPRSVVLGFRSWTMDKTKYDNDRTLVIDFDASSINLGAMELLERRLDPNMELSNHRYFVESLEMPLPYETFLRITNAAKVKLTLAGTELSLRSEHLEAFRDLVSRIN